MTDESQTAQELHDSIVASRGGSAKFTPEQMRIVHALVAALARKPNRPATCDAIARHAAADNVSTSR